MSGRLCDITTPATLRADAMAGLLGAVLALPQGIAFATLAGLPPQYGIYSAIVPCAVAALFGSSHHVVSGPTNANSLALFAALSPLAIPGSPQFIAFAIAVTGLVGVMQLAVGGFKLGWVTDFIAPAVLVGFMSGAAILIGLYALPDFLGLQLPNSHGPFGVLSGLAAKIRDLSLSAVIVGAWTLVATITVARISRRLPFMLIGIIVGFITSELLEKYSQWPSVARIGSIPSVLPPFSVPSISFSMLPQFVPIAGALSIVALGQSVSIAKALAQRSGQRLDVNREFIGQGMSNIVGSFFSCYVSCGSLNRSLPNFLAGARTQFAAVLSAIFLVVLAFATRPLLERLPMPAIAALLVYIAYGLIDVRGFARLARVNQADLGVASLTLGGMLFLPFQQAILIGTGLALLLYLTAPRIPQSGRWFPTPHPRPGRLRLWKNSLVRLLQCPQLKLARVEGSIYFGAAGYLSQRLHDMRNGSTQNHLLVMAKSMNHIDLAGDEVWEQELNARRKTGGDLYFHRPRSAVRQLWAKTGFDGRLGLENIFATKKNAIKFIYRRLTILTFAQAAPNESSANVRNRARPGSRTRSPPTNRTTF